MIKKLTYFAGKATGRRFNKTELNDGQPYQNLTDIKRSNSKQL
jgi:hypothetical protein